MKRRWIDVEDYKKSFYTKFSSSSISILHEYEYNKFYVIIKYEFGLCKVRKDHLFNGYFPTIESAINKNEYFINKARTIHGDKYEYSLFNYTTAHKKSTIICPIHGEFEQSAHVHLDNKCGCSKCGDLRCSSHHKEESSGWTKTNWVKAANKSKRFDSFKVYIIECWNENEKFYKIGRTFLQINKRFANFPYKYKVLNIIKSDASQIFKLESELKRLNKNNRYNPMIKFGGCGECFTEIIFNKLI